MNGRGWECDYCGTREITEMPPLYNYHHIHDAPPIGWFTIVGPSTGPMNSENGYLAVDRKEFCSWKCIENYSYIQHSEQDQVNDDNN